jgi:hypothetical protein
VVAAGFDLGGELGAELFRFADVGFELLVYRAVLEGLAFEQRVETEAM